MTALQGVPKYCIPLMEWHRRFGHLNSRYLELLSKKGLVEGLGPIAKQGITCKTCPIGKGTRQSFPKSKSKAKKAFELIHSDLSGPMRTLSRQGFSYVHSITDDKTRFSFVYFLRGKTTLTKFSRSFSRSSLHNLILKLYVSAPIKAENSLTIA